MRHSIKKFKESQHFARVNEKSHIEKPSSYKDKLVGAIPGAFEQAFGFESLMQEDIELDTKDENTHEGSARVCFSKRKKHVSEHHGNMHSSSNLLEGKLDFYS